MAECQEERARGKKWEVETGWDKRLSFPLPKRSNMTYRGHERDDETGQRKEIRRHTGTKGKQTELMWLPGPICIVFNSPENFLATPTFHSLNSPLNPFYPQTHSSCCTLSPLKLPCMLNLFICIARGPSQATRMCRMGQERGVWEGDWFIFKITQTQTLHLKQS